MGLAEAVLARAPAPVENRAMQTTPWGDWGTSLGTSAGVNVSHDTAVQLLAVYGSVQLISDTIATLPRKIYRNQDQGAAELSVKPKWFEQPNPTTDIIDFLTQTLTSLLLDGNAYWTYAVDLNFAPTTLAVLNASEVDIRDGEYFVRGQRFVGRLLHIKGVTQAGAVKGMSPLEAARQSIGIGLASQEFAGRFYSNGTTLSGVIQVPGELKPDAARIMRDSFSRDHGGSSKAHLPGVLTGGATWTQMSITPEQAQFLQSREFQAAEICSQMFLLDPAMLGISIGSKGNNLTYANLEQRGIHLVQFTLMRWIMRLERAFTFLLPKPQYMKFNVDGLQRADLLTRYQAYRVALGPTQPFLAVNEPRELEDLPSMAGHDTLPEPAAPPPPPAPPVEPAKAAEPPVTNNSFRFVMPPVQVIPPDVHVHPEVRGPDVHVTAEPVVNIPETRIEFQPQLPITIEVNPTPIEVHPPEVNVSVSPAENRIDVHPTPIEVAPAEVNVNIAPAETRIEVNPTPIEVTVEAPDVNFTAPDVTVEAAQITVNQPEIRVEAPEVTILPPEIRVEQPDIYIDQPDITVEAPSVQVHNRPPAIRIDAPVINLPKPGAIRRRFERDENDSILSIIEEPYEPEGSDEGPDT